MTERVKGRSYLAGRDVVDDAKIVRAEIAAYRKARVVPAGLDLPGAHRTVRRRQLDRHHCDEPACDLRLQP